MLPIHLWSVKNHKLSFTTENSYVKIFSIQTFSVRAVPENKMTGKTFYLQKKLRLLTFLAELQNCSGSTCGPRSSGWEPLVYCFELITLSNHLHYSKFNVIVLECTCVEMSSWGVKMSKSFFFIPFLGFRIELIFK